MSANTLTLSVVLAGFLGATSGLAVQDEMTQGANPYQATPTQSETSQKCAKSSVFVGVQLGMAQAVGKLERTVTNTATGVSARIGDNSEDDIMGSRFGIVVGYNQFLTNKAGIRYYGVFDFGQYGEDGSYVSAFNFNANIDALYNFFSQEETQLYVFGGLYLGYTQSGTMYNVISVSGADMGINLGLQVKIQEHHNMDIYGRFGFLEQSESISESGVFTGVTYTGDAEITVKQPFQIGIRYTYSF